ncbi:hypothetical protein [Amycolatopsis sp. EV170708-02-1]|uniref:hypothetical protein n=1 Tax=Amycolatopsis sp. EV170708-02-1 TaxID=2919322 RepID=UPI001F0C0B36|nr:hypothetical protein [Amycolatopsis sp. EV170708-02-1]UMP06966.1 hypothetical protein MJQ72_20080 [Amycolatopsis sp. EV170708-02-1]
MAGILLDVTDPVVGPAKPLPLWMKDRIRDLRDGELLKWEGHFADRSQPALVEKQIPGWLNQAEMVGGAVDLILARAGDGSPGSRVLQMPDIRVRITSDLDESSEVLNGMFEHVEKLFRDELRPRGRELEDLGLNFTREIVAVRVGSFSHQGDVRISVHETPERALVDYWKEKQLTERAISTMPVLAEAARERIMPMLDGFVESWINSKNGKPKLEYGIAATPSSESTFTTGAVSASSVSSVFHVRVVRRLVWMGISGALTRRGEADLAGTIWAKYVHFTPYYDAPKAGVVFDVLEHGQKLKAKYTADEVEGEEVVARGRVEAGQGGVPVLSSVDSGALAGAAQELVGRVSREPNTGFEGVGVLVVVQVSAAGVVDGSFRAIAGLIRGELSRAIEGVVGVLAGRAGDLPVAWNISAVPVEDAGGCGVAGRWWWSRGRGSRWIIIGR